MGNQSQRVGRSAPPPAPSSAANGGAPAGQRAQKGIVLRTYQFIVTDAGVSHPAPGINVPPGCIVRARALNNAAGGNTGLIWLGSYREAYANGQAIPLAPLDDVQYQVENLSHIWVTGPVGNGVIFSIIEQFA